MHTINVKPITQADPIPFAQSGQTVLEHELKELLQRRSHDSSVYISLRNKQHNHPKLVCGFISTILMLCVTSNLVLFYQYHMDYWSLLFLSGSELLISFTLTLIIFAIALKLNECIKNQNHYTQSDYDVII